MVTYSIGEGYCNQAQKDLASKSQGAADALNSLMNGETWNAIKTTANAAYNGDQIALENLSGILVGITVPSAKLPKGISANEKLPVIGKTTDYPKTEFNYKAHNVANYDALKMDLKTQQAANTVIESLQQTGKLPENIIIDTVTQMYSAMQLYNANRFKGFDIHTANTRDTLEFNEFIEKQLIPNGMNVIIVMINGNRN